MRKGIYKAKVELDDNGKLKITSYVNRRIPAVFRWDINNAMQEIAKRFNGELDWQEKFIRFTHDGVTYEQVPSDKYCEGCVFCEHKNGINCQHPHYLDGSKGICEKKIYVKIKDVNQN